MLFLSNVTNREKEIWANILLDLIVAGYFFPRVLRLEGGLADNAGELAVLISTVIAIAIFWSILIYWLLDVGKAEAKDERDYLFEAKSALAGYHALAITISLLVGHIILNQTIKEIFNIEYEPLDSLKIAIYLLLALVVCAFVKDIIKLFYYRRGH